MSNISPDPMDTQMTQAEIDEMMKLNTTGEMSAFRERWLLDHGYVQRDEYRPDVLHKVQKVAEAAPKFKIKVAGQEFTANTLAELEAQYTPVLQAAMAANAAARVQTDDAPRNANGTFAKQPTVTDDADRITNDLVLKTLLKEGIDPDALRDATALKSHEKAWAHASKEWLATQTPESYPGGEQLGVEMQKKLELLGLTDYPSAANIQKAYDAVCADADRYIALRDAKTPEEIEAIIGKTQRESERRVTRGNV
jgi:hypothetical protein